MEFDKIKERESDVKGRKWRGMEGGKRMKLGRRTGTVL